MPPSGKLLEKENKFTTESTEGAAQKLPPCSSVPTVVKNKFQRQVAKDAKKTQSNMVSCPDLIRASTTLRQYIDLKQFSIVATWMAGSDPRIKSGDGHDDICRFLRTSASTALKIFHRRGRKGTQRSAKAIISLAAIGKTT